jgi:hypothetical protein
MLQCGNRLQRSEDACDDADGAGLLLTRFVEKDGDPAQKTSSSSPLCFNARTGTIEMIEISHRPRY